MNMTYIIQNRIIRIYGSDDEDDYNPDDTIKTTGVCFGSQIKCMWHPMH